LYGGNSKCIDGQQAHATTSLDSEPGGKFCYGRRFANTRWADKRNDTTITWLGSYRAANPQFTGYGPLQML
jgi:hypothetical protein